MKDCAKIHPMLSLYLEDVLSPKETALVEAHLKTCEVAKHELKELKGLNKALRGIPEPRFPKGLHDRVMAKVHEKPAPTWAWGGWSLAAAACLVALFGIQYLNNPPKPKPEVVLSPVSRPNAVATNSIVSLIRPMPHIAKPKNAQLALASRPTPSGPVANGNSIELDAISMVPTKTPEMVVAMAAIPQARVAKKSHFLAGGGAASVAQGDFGETLNDQLTTKSVLSGNTATEGSDYNLNPQNAQDASGQQITSAIQSKQSFGGITYSTGNNSTGAEYQLKSAPLPGADGLIHKPGFGVTLTAPHQYQVNWETELTSIGEVFVVDAQGNTLQSFNQDKNYVYDHQQNIDTSTLNSDFMVKLLMDFGDGSQAVTQAGPFKP